MTDNNHPITPPPELQEQWKQEWLSVRPSFTSFHEWMLAKSARWGADQELEACLEEIRDGACRLYVDDCKLRMCLADDIWTARRSKPKSLEVTL